MRYAVAGRGTVVGTTVRAMASLYATTGVRPRVMEVGVFNTTTTELAVALVRFTNATGVGAGLTEVALSDPAQTAIATGFAGHTADGAVGSPIRQATLGAAKGSGVIWTFQEPGILIPNTTSDGLGIIVPTGTGQICDYYIEWEE